MTYDCQMVDIIIDDERNNNGASVFCVEMTTKYKRRPPITIVSEHIIHAWGGSMTDN